MRSTALLCVLTCSLLSVACSSTRMVETKRDSATGRTITTEYTKFYAAGDWLKEGEVGVDAWIDHEKEVVPILHTLQQATGTLGPGDLEATGLVTLYFVNLTTNTTTLKVTRLVNGKGQASSLKPTAITLEPRSLTRFESGRFPIFNYGTEIKVSLDYEIGGIRKLKQLTLKRLTDAEYARYGRLGQAPYPWFNPPYFPFNPPLSFKASTNK